ncbi:MAG: PilZ domain-containing protein [Bdellovibrionaceae bacterium]|nr:PilZ domain-containing protein [Pseudobdellovibrionaceae bacterium]
MTETTKPAPRVPLCLPIEFRKSYARDANKGGLLNISLTGAFLEHGPEDLLVNDKINLHFKVSGRERVLQACIVWQNSNGSGVSFNPENNQDVQIIDDLMYFVRTYRDSKRAVLDSIFSQIKN